MSERVTPHSLEAERAVLGAILIEPSLFLDVADLLAADDFFREPHRRIYAAMRELATAGQTVDPIVLRERLKVRGDLEDIGGPAYLYALTDGVPRSTNIEAYAGIVKERAMAARLIDAAHQMIADTADDEKTSREMLDAAERRIFAIGEQSVRGDFIDAGALVAEGIPAIERLLEDRNGATGLQTGFHEFDAMTRGLQPGALVLLAARPSMGKSAFALNVAYNAASHGKAVGFMSLEMSREELFFRLVASVGRIDGHRLQSGYVSQADYGQMSEAFGQIGQTGLFVDDSSTVGVLDLRGKARRLKARHGLDLLIVDYLQLMQLAKAENRNLAVADASRALKLLARELRIPVMALSQLSRETEKRAEKKPMLSDLRDSGALEQDADMVVFIHRAEVYDRNPAHEGLAEIIIAKSRNGPIGTVELRWDKTSTRFDNVSVRS